MHRRTFLSVVAGTLAAPRLFSQAAAAARKVALYANVGGELAHYDVDVASAALTRRGTVTLPADVQYAWPHASGRYLYVASSDGAAGYGRAGSRHHVTAFRIDPGTGALSRHGPPRALPTRPIHLTTDIPSAHILVAFNHPSALRVYRIGEDFVPGAEVAQPGTIDAGVYAHQVRVTRDNARVILAARGNEAAAGRAGDPGALKVFSYRDGVLGNGVSIAPEGGRNFGPRHLDFHPARPWMYVLLEAQNTICTFRIRDGDIDPTIAFRTGTLAEPGNLRSRQAASAIHVHPNGRFLYAANRAQDTIRRRGRAVFKGGENSIVVCSIDQSTGEPKPIQHVDTRGIHPRTFHVEPGGRLLVAQHNRPLSVMDGDSVRTAEAGLSVFRVGADGRLAFVRKYDVDVGRKQMFWMGMVPL